MKTELTTNSNTPPSYCQNYLPKVVAATAVVAAVSFVAFGACFYLLHHTTMAWSFLGVGASLTAIDIVLASVLAYKRKSGVETSLQKNNSTVDLQPPLQNAISESHNEQATTSPREVEESPNSESPIDDPKAKLEKLQEDFWNEFYKEKTLKTVNLKSIFQMLVLQKEYDLREIITSVVNQYNSIVKYSLDDEQKYLLLNCILYQMEKFPVQEASSLNKILPDRIQPDFSHELLELPDCKALITQFTLGDGSCGLHALLGELKDGKCKVDNIQQIRSEFCDWIRSKKDDLPTCINLVLDDYFLCWNNLDISESFSALKTEKNNRMWQRLFSAFRSQTDENTKDEIRQQFRNEILEDYLKNLEKVGTYLRQEELIVAAECFGKTLTLYQPDWKNQQPIGCTFNPGSSDEVVIWYNGVNHYERAVILE